LTPRSSRRSARSSPARDQLVTAVEVNTPDRPASALPRERVRSLGAKRTFAKHRRLLSADNGLMRRSKQHLQSTIFDRAGASLREFELASALEVQQAWPKKRTPPVIFSVTF
jgi:hypothetical protein